MAARSGFARSVVYAVAVALALTACSGSADRASPLPTPTTSSPKSATPTPKPSTAKQEVEAAVREFYAALDVALRTGETNRYLVATVASCNCRDFVRQVEANFVAGRFPGAGASVVDVGRVDVHGSAAAATVVYEIHPYTEVRDGRTVRSFPRRERNVSLGLVKRGTWKVSSSIDLAGAP